jgi:hypothetical protein
MKETTSSNTRPAKTPKKLLRNALMHEMHQAVRRKDAAARYVSVAHSSNSLRAIKSHHRLEAHDK